MAANNNNNNNNHHHQSSKQFELKSGVILTKVLALKGAKNISLTHNTKLQSIARSLKRQVDLLLEYELNGEARQVAIEAKQHTRRVSLPIYSSFVGMLVDLESKPEGMMISAKGFQKGVFESAEARGIKLCALIEAQPEHFPDKQVPSIEATGKALYLSASSFQLGFKELSREDKEWADAIAAQKKQDLMLKFDDENTFTIADIVSQLSFHYRDQALEDEVVGVEFQKPCFLPRENKAPLQVNHVLINLTLKTMAEFKMENRIEGFFVETQTGGIYTVDANDNVSCNGSDLVAYGPVIDLAPYFPHLKK